MKIQVIYFLVALSSNLARASPADDDQYYEPDPLLEIDKERIVSELKDEPPPQNEMDLFAAPNLERQPILEKVQVKGMYYWELYLDIDNTANSGNITRQMVFKKSVNSSYTDLKNHIYDEILSSSIAGEYKASLFGIIGCQVESKLSLEMRFTYESMIESQDGIYTEISRTDTFEVGPHSRLKLYYLVFDAPGIRYRTETVSSTPHDLGDVVINVTIKHIPVLQDIDVRYGEHEASMPNNVISMDGPWPYHPDVNHGHGGKYVWLVPKWSYGNVGDAVTGITMVKQNSPNPKLKNIAEGTGQYRYLILQRQKNLNKITKMALYRLRKKEGDPLKDNWERRTDNLNKDRGGETLYLAYSTLPVNMA